MSSAILVWSRGDAMAYRPYPNADRALRTLDRHYPPESAIPTPPALRAVGDFIGQFREDAQQAAAQNFGAGAYVLSTRRGDTGSVNTGDGASAITVDARSVRPWTQAERAAWYRGEGSPRPGVVSGDA